MVVGIVEWIGSIIYGSTFEGKWLAFIVVIRKDFLPSNYFLKGLFWNIMSDPAGWATEMEGTEWERGRENAGGLQGLITTE